MLSRRILEAIQAQGGRATLGDLMSATALSSGEIEQAILPALSEVGGHVAVDDNGELIYSVERRRRLPGPPRLARFGATLYATFRVLFVALLSVMLVAYFGFYVLLLTALAVAAVVAASAGGDCDCPCDCDCSGGDGCGLCGECCQGCDAGTSCCDCSTGRRNNDCGDALAGCLVCGEGRKLEKQLARDHKRADIRERRRQRRVRREGRREARQARRQQTIKRLRGRLGLTSEPAHLGLTLEREALLEKPPFSRAVHDFIFGPPRPKTDPLARERNVLAFVRTHEGRITASDAVALTGLALDPADAVLLDVAARYEGDIAVMDDAVIVYTFDRVLVSAAEERDVLEWIQAQGGAVTVSAFARHTGCDAAQALRRLQHLARLLDGTVEHGRVTRFVFPEDTGEQIDEIAARTDTLRDYTFCWERLALSPIVVGVPRDRRGWIIGFNLFNMILAAVLTGLYRSGFSFFEAAWEPIIFAYLPLAFSVSVFTIPLLRTAARSVADRARLRRNAHHVFLLGLFHVLEEADRTGAQDIARALFSRDAVPQRKHLLDELERVAGELDGRLDVEVGTAEPTYVFARVHEELTSVARERLAVDLDALSLSKIVYDTAEPDEIEA